MRVEEISEKVKAKNLPGVAEITEAGGLIYVVFDTNDEEVSPLSTQQISALQAYYTFCDEFADRLNVRMFTFRRDDWQKEQLVGAFKSKKKTLFSITIE